MKALGTVLNGVIARPPEPAPGTAVVAERRAPADRNCMAVRSIPVAPELDPATRHAVAAWRVPHPDFGYERSLATPVVVENAKLALRQLELRHRPATIEDWRGFLFPLSGNNTGNAPSGNAFEIAVADIASGMGEVPVFLLSKTRVDEALQRFEYFPRVFQLNKWLRPLISQAESERAALRRLAGAEPFVPRPPLTPEEIERRKAHASEKTRHQAALRLAEEERDRAERAAIRARLPKVTLTPEQAAAVRAGARTGDIIPRAPKESK